MHTKHFATLNGQSLKFAQSSDYLPENVHIQTVPSLHRRRGTYTY